MDDIVTRAEHEEFVKRIDERDKRQDKRLELLEENVKQLGSLTASVEKLAMSMDRMCKEQEKQGIRLEELESRPVRHINSITSTARTALITAAITSLVSVTITWIIASVF